MAFDVYTFRKRRKQQRTWGLVLLWGGLAVLIIDLFTPYPTTVRGEFAAVELLAMIVGGAIWIMSRRLPTDEALEVARMSRYQGVLTPLELASELRVTVDTARRTLGKLVEMDVARAEQIKDRTVWKFPTIRIAPVLPGETAGPWRCGVCWQDNRSDSLACSQCKTPRIQGEVKNTSELSAPPQSRP